MALYFCLLSVHGLIVTELLRWISLVILRGDRESSIEAYQLTTVYVMISISDQTDLIQTKQRTMNTVIKVKTRSAYGNTLIDIVDPIQRDALQSLTGNKTLTKWNVKDLKTLGFTFELVQKDYEFIESAVFPNASDLA